MNSARYRFSALRNCSLKELPILDLWLDEKPASTDAPVCIPLWRTLINKFCEPSASPSNELLAAFSTYQSHFQNPATDEDLESFFTRLCAKIKWNKIPLSPTGEEIKSACKALKQDVTPKESKKIIDAIRHNAAGDIETRSLEIIYMEWLFLQRLCDQARWDLMESVYLYLAKASKDQA